MIEGRNVEDIAVNAGNILELETKWPDPRLARGMLMLASSSWDSDACDELGLLEESDRLEVEAYADRIDTVIGGQCDGRCNVVLD